MPVYQVTDPLACYPIVSAGVRADTAAEAKVFACQAMLGCMFEHCDKTVVSEMMDQLLVEEVRR